MWIGVGPHIYALFNKNKNIWNGTLVSSLIAEYIMKMGKYESIVHARWAYVVFSTFSTHLYSSQEITMLNI